MNIEKLRDYCLRMKGVTEGFPFDEDTLVFKVMGKMFCLTSLGKPTSCNLKCDPERAVALREEFAQVQPGYHMNKRLWNTVQFDGPMDESLFEELVRHSYDLVVQSLTKVQRQELEQLSDQN